MGIQHWYGIARRLLPVSWPFAHCATGAPNWALLQTLRQVWHCTAVLTGQETGMLGQTRCAPGLKQVKGQLSSLQQPQFHLPPPHHTQGSKTGKCCTSKAGPAALATAEQQQEHDSFKEEAKCKTQLHFFICIILSVSPQKP